MERARARDGERLRPTLVVRGRIVGDDCVTGVTNGCIVCVILHDFARGGVTERAVAAAAIKSSLRLVTSGFATDSEPSAGSFARGRGRVSELGCGGVERAS